MMLRVAATGPLVTVQDAGRPGWAHLGVPRSGFLDAPAARLANRLVGNHDDAACLEVVLGGLTVTTDADVWLAVTGAPCPVSVEGRAREHSAAVRLPAGAVLELGVPATGVRSYVAVAGGLVVEPVLGSRSTDTLGGLGPPPLTSGDLLPVGPAARPPSPLDTPLPTPGGPLRVRPGPRADWVEGDVVDRLVGTSYVVSADSDRVGLRLQGPPLPRVRSDELPSEGIVLGAVQLPPDGRPVVFLADHPTTGGYPVVAVVEADDLRRCAQLRPGETVRFSRVGPGATRGAPGRRPEAT